MKQLTRRCVPEGLKTDSEYFLTADHEFLVKISKKEEKKLQDMRGFLANWAAFAVL